MSYGCSCYRCINECACRSAGSTCRGCLEHFAAIADAAASEAEAKTQHTELYNQYRERELVELLKKAQNRLRNQGGEIHDLTQRANFALHDEIELKLGGDLFLMPIYYPDKDPVS